MDATAGSSTTVRGRALRSLAAGAVALAVLSAFVALVGVGDVLAAARRADRGLLAGVVLAEAGGVVLFGLGLAATLRALGHPVSGARAVGTFLATTFVSNATPFGRAGGNPFSAVVVAWAARARYETGLAGIVAVHTVYNLLGVAVGVAGVALLAVGWSASGNLLRGAAVAGGAVLGMLAGLAALWRFREPIAAVLRDAFARVAAWAGPRLPGVDPEPGEVAGRVDGFVADVEAFVGSPRTLAAVVSLGAVGQVLVAGALWVALLAVGHRVPLPLVLAVVPLSWVAAAGPTPGGVGGIDLVLVGALAATTAVPTAPLTAAVLLYRVVTFWVPTTLGGAVAAGIALSRESAL